jgi:hypothetical protein
VSVEFPDFSFFFILSSWAWRHQRGGDKKCLLLLLGYYCVIRHKRLPFFLTRFPPSRWVIDHRQCLESTPLITWTPFSTFLYFLLFSFLLFLVETVSHLAVKITTFCPPPSGRINNYAQVQLFLKKKNPETFAVLFPKFSSFYRAWKGDRSPLRL